MFTLTSFIFESCSSRSPRSGIRPSPPPMIRISRLRQESSSRSFLPLFLKRSLTGIPTTDTMPGSVPLSTSMSLVSSAPTRYASASSDIHSRCIVRSVIQIMYGVSSCITFLYSPMYAAPIIQVEIMMSGEYMSISLLKCFIKYFLYGLNDDFSVRRFHILYIHGCLPTVALYIGYPNLLILGQIYSNKSMITVSLSSDSLFIFSASASEAET